MSQTKTHSLSLSLSYTHTHTHTHTLFPPLYILFCSLIHTHANTHLLIHTILHLHIHVLIGPFGAVLTVEKTSVLVTVKTTVWQEEAELSLKEERFDSTGKATKTPVWSA